jgi:hypothetical protein
MKDAGETVRSVLPGAVGREDGGGLITGEASSVETPPSPNEEHHADRRDAKTGIGAADPLPEVWTEGQTPVLGHSEASEFPIADRITVLPSI